MQRCFFLFLLCLVMLSFNAEAKIVASKYVEPDLIELTKFNARYNTFNLNDPTTFKEYLKITDCKLAADYKDSPFKMQEIQQQVIKTIGSAQENKSLYFRVPVSFQVSGYNFDTQSLPIIPESQFKKVNMIELTPQRMILCNRENTFDFTKLSSYYVVKLNAPISIYRLPIQRNIAESFFNKLKPAVEDGSERMVYGYMLIEIDTIQPEIAQTNFSAKFVLRGEINAINLYLDQNYTMPLKTLDFSENF